MFVILSRVGVVILNILIFFLEEGWIIAMVALLPFWLAIILVTLLLSFFAIATSILCRLAVLPCVVEKWIQNQKEKANHRLEKTARRAIWIASLITAILISPTTSAVMLYISGIKGLKAIFINVLFSLVSGSIWCAIYSGAILIFKRVL
jgi:hypothetical protein